jgi:hypothetical protein
MPGVFQNINPRPPPPFCLASVYPPPPLVRGEDTLSGWRGGWGSIFCKTPDTALSSTYVSTLCYTHKTDADDIRDRRTVSLFLNNIQKGFSEQLCFLLHIQYVIIILMTFSQETEWVTMPPNIQNCNCNYLFHQRHDVLLVLPVLPISAITRPQSTVEHFQHD